MYSLQTLETCKTTTEKYLFLGRPFKMPLPLTFPLWKQGELVIPIKPLESIVGNSVHLGDFGLTIKAGTLVTPTVQSPFQFCAPERFYGALPTFATDMWSYFCIFYQLYADFPLIYGYGVVSVVSYIISTFGHLPEAWKGSYSGFGSHEESWYDPQRGPRPGGTLEARILQARPEVSPAERELVLSILTRGFSYLPEHRLTAAQLLQDSSFRALMSIYGL